MGISQEFTIVLLRKEIRELKADVSMLQAELEVLQRNGGYQG